MRGVLAVTIGLLACCGSAPKAALRAPAVNMFWTTDDGRMARYDVSSTGRLSFAGGYDARNEIWSWTGTLDDSQAAALSKVVRDAGWVTSPPKDGRGTDTWVVSIKTSGGHRSFEVKGDPPSVLEAWEILNRAGQARLQPDLDLLPSPDIDALVKRRQAEQKGGAP